MIFKRIVTSKYFIRPVVAAAIAFGLMRIVGSDVNSDLLMSTLCGSSDIEVSDFYNRIHAGGTSKDLSDEYLIVNIDSVTERADLAELLGQVAAGAPKAVGLDVIFATPRDPDADMRLAAQLDMMPYLVAAQRYSDAEGLPAADMLSAELPDARRGMANLTATRHHGVVREITPFFGDSLQFPSFAAAMLEITEPGAYEKLRQRSGDQLIRFADEEYYVAEPAEIMADPQICRDKIVFVATVTEEGDLHQTPLGDDIPGVMIHIHALDMMRHGRYVNPQSHIYNTALGLLACLIMTLLYVYLDAAQNFVMRTLPIAWMFAILFIGCAAFSYWGIYLNAPMTMLMAALSLFVLDTWYAFEKPVTKLFHKINNRLKGLPTTR